MAFEDPKSLADWVQWAIGGVIAFSGTVVGFLFHRVIEKHDEEIKAIKASLKEIDDDVEKKLDKVDWETNRREARENVIGLHTRLEAKAAEIHARIDVSDQTSTRRHEDLMRTLLEIKRDRSS